MSSPKYKRVVLKLSGEALAEIKALVSIRSDQIHCHRNQGIGRIGRRSRSSCWRRKYLAG